MNVQQIGECRIEMSDLTEFARTSGDWNPIHTDPVAARRLLAGGVVAHGLSTLLWMLEQHLVASGQVPQSLAAIFPRPLSPGDMVTLAREEAEQGEQRLAVLLDGDEVSSAVLSIGGGSRIPGTPLQGLPHADVPADNEFAQIKQASGTLSAMSLDARSQAIYPQVFEQLGPRVIAGLMTVSRLVGMHCPGLHSLIAAIQLTFDPACSSDIVEWRVTRHSVPHAPVRIAFKGSGLEGYVDAFVRPAPVQQPTYLALLGRVGSQEFANQVALVIGGSRGLGELAAKLIAAGGGDVIVTHREGHDDAQRVASEITALGGKCRIARFDSERARDDIETILSTVAQPTHVYYFAAPRIGRAKSKLFSPAIFRSFMQVFVEGFGQTAVGLASSAGKVRLFYPSTVFLDEYPKDQSEYIAAKAAGEALCQQLDKHASTLTTLSMRLPRLNTDQSAGLLSRSASDAVPSVIGIVRAMNALDCKKAGE